MDATVILGPELTTRNQAWSTIVRNLAALPKLFECASAKRLIVLGDFNQQVGQNGYAPPRIRDVLQEALPTRITIATAAPGLGGQKVIDHVALSEDLSAQSVRVISRFHQDRKLSDHHGAVAELSALQ